MRRNEFEAKVGDHIEAILNEVEEADRVAFQAVQDYEAIRGHLVAIGGLYCDVCHGLGNGATPPKSENHSLTYAFELHMRDKHDGHFSPGPDPKDPYTADEWRTFAEIVVSGSRWKLVEHPSGEHAHLNDGHGRSVGDVMDKDDNVILSQERQVQMWKELHAWQSPQPH